jgi:prevent-host-death family protein
MRFIGIRDLRNKLSQIRDELDREKEIIITSNGKPIAILSAVSEDNLEEQLEAFRQARAVAAVNALQRASARSGADKIALNEINEEIQAVRRERAKRAVS